MTAPLTPPEPSHSEPSEFPPYPGATLYPAEDAGGSREPIGKELVRGVLVAVLVAVCGVALGLLWLWLSPRVPMVSDGQAVYLKDTEGEEAIGGDGTFVLIALVLGVLTAAAVFWRLRKGGVAVVLGLAAGGVLASVVGWKIGVWLGPTTDIVAHAKEVGPKVVFDGPLELRAKSALVVWPAAAMVVHLALTYAFGPRDELPQAQGYPGYGTYGEHGWSRPAAVDLFKDGRPEGSGQDRPAQDRPGQDHPGQTSGQEHPASARPGQDPSNGDQPPEDRRPRD